MSHQRVSGFPEKGADLWEVRRTSGEVRGTSGEVCNFRGTSALLALRAQSLKKFKILKFSSEIEVFQASHPPNPYFFVENSEGQDRKFRARLKFSGETETFKRDLFLVAQCSATPATVAATPPCSATPFQTQISVRHLAQGGGRCDTKNFRGCSATPVLHLQNAIKSRKSAVTRVARHV